MAFMAKRKCELFKAIATGTDETETVTVTVASQSPSGKLSDATLRVQQWTMYGCILCSSSNLQVVFHPGRLRLSYRV
jgi:hypothetical protein